MSGFLIKGGTPLEGEVEISGAKNAVLPVLAATVLGAGKISLTRVPNLSDVKVMRDVLINLGSNVIWDKGRMLVDTSHLNSCQIPEELMSQMRASIFLMGPLLARYGKVEIYQPGGCSIGPRPIDLHLKGLEALGAEFEQKHGVLSGQANRLKGAEINLDFPSVGATENIMMAAVRAEGKTVISNAAKEPEIINLQNFLNSMGAKISGAGTDEIKIKGVKQLEAVEYEIIPDRIEASTFLVAGAISQGEIFIKDIIPEHMEAVLSKLVETGTEIRIGKDWVEVSGVANYQGIDLQTIPYPGFPTDVQAQFMTLLCLAEGTSLIKENIFENRLRHAEELRRMGAKIKIEGNTAIVKSKDKLSGARVEAMDLRAGAALVLAGIVAEGNTVVEKIYHIDRGYENFEHKLTKLGANIVRTKDSKEAIKAEG